MPALACMIAGILSRVDRLEFCGLLLVSVILTIPTFAGPANPELIVDSVNVGQEGVVSFSTLSLGSETRSDFPAPRFLLGQTDDQAFRLYVDVDSIQQVRFNAFTLTAYLAGARDAARGAYKFQITGNPTGSFRDAPVRVPFHVKTGSGSFPGGILMPVYNAAKTDLLVADKQSEPIYVSVSGSSAIRIRLSNVTDSLPILVTDVAVSEDCPKCWTRVSSTINEKSPLIVDPGTSANLPFDLSPNSIPALLQGALVINRDVPHDTLSLALTYHTVPGGADRRQTVPAKVRFGPGLFGLALALCGGVALGLAARYVLTGKFGKENERTVHAILSAFVLGLVAEFVGVMLTAYGESKLVLFGLDIDPRQLFPAFILAILVSGGTAVVSWVKEFFSRAQ